MLRDLELSPIDLVIYEDRMYIADGNNSGVYVCRGTLATTSSLPLLHGLVGHLSAAVIPHKILMSSGLQPSRPGGSCMTCCERGHT